MEAKIKNKDALVKQIRYSVPYWAYNDKPITAFHTKEQIEDSSPEWIYFDNLEDAKRFLLSRELKDANMGFIRKHFEHYDEESDTYEDIEL